MNWIKVTEDLPKKQLGNKSRGVLICIAGTPSSDKWFERHYDWSTEEWIANGYWEQIHGVTH